MKRISPIKQVSMKASLILKYQPIAISLVTADTEFTEVVSLIQRRFEEHRTE